MKDLLALFNDQLARAADKFGGIHSIIVDGLADMVADVNDAGGSSGFVSMLHGKAIEFDCPIIGVIHQNPNGEKTRGHLGSQLERKAESNLTMEKDGEVTSVWSTKQRGAPILKGKGPTFAWDNEAGMHVSCTTEGQAASERLEDMLCERDDVFLNHPSMRYTDLVNEVTKRLKIGDRSAKRRIKLWTNSSVIERTVANLYVPKNCA